MERREQYDPEDIESLLQERSYDELLEEERAYVLRHLSGREEYEAMRALLGNVREDDRRRAPLVADRAVREHVMAAYRANLRPQWQVWLNNIGMLLWPKEMSDLWRPALALGSVALLITAGVWVTRSMEAAQEPAQVAELKNEVAKPEKTVGMETPAAGFESDSQATTRSTAAPATEGFAQLEAKDASVEATAAVTEEDMATDREAEAAPVAEMRREERSVLADEVTAAPAAVSVTGATMSHVVTDAELFSNQSVANASGGVRLVETTAMEKRKKEEAHALTTSLGANPELLALLSNGW